ncbi:hypothetical protein H5410_051179 [Solanum commersonii]|uniref:Uncharacterized protein n=1 Tax=Solanum commersonii TaxID=4109 RepID=A0A9J5X068_SOLCO|nr:hypothetical protein H5410_051179 [Solanum commersonii]
MIMRKGAASGRAEWMSERCHATEWGIALISCGDIWVIYPVLVSPGYIYGGVNIFIAIILSIFTLSTFSLFAFRCASAPPNILWGSYPAVTKGALENYRFCEYCAKSKILMSYYLK